MSLQQLWSRLKLMVERYRVYLSDGVFLLAFIALAAYLAFEYDIFENAPGEPPKTQMIELDEALALGALFCTSLLVFAGRRLYELNRETKRRIQAEREARMLALHDPLTGLPNRRQFNAALQAAIDAPPRSGACHAAFMLDLNGFKKVNDVHGHAAGDELLVHVGGRFARCMRNGDMVARLGGDEFAVLAHHLAGPDEASGIALRILDCLKEPVAIGSMHHRVGAGLGIALIPQDGRSSEEVMRKADIALYRAKADGSSSMRFFEAEMDARVGERDFLETELRAAIGTPALRAYYQPIVELKTDRVVGFEALAHWTHATMGEIGPDRFIPIAEDCGLIAALTDSLLDQAFCDAMAWPDDIALSFNISPAQLRDRTLGLRVMALLGRIGLNPNRLELEITESALVRDMHAAQETLGALRQSGVRIALADFGTGYSSLYHLRNFKLDKIKIDRSFVERMSNDRDSAAIVRALIGLGTGLCLAVSAEGVENAEQRERLIADGCSDGQGFLFSKAVPADEALELVAPQKTAAVA